MASKVLLRQLGVNAVPHGFRSSFRDWCGEIGIAREVAELCLSHSVGSKVEQAYARSNLYRRRCRVMEAWSAYVTGGGSDWEGIPGVLNPVFGPP